MSNKYVNCSNVHSIQVFPKSYVAQRSIKVLSELKKTNALILSLNEPSIPYLEPVPYFYFKKISSSEKLPKNLKLDGDPLKDYFYTLQTIRGSTSGSSAHKSGFYLLCFKVTDEDKVYLADKSWTEWSGALRYILAISKFMSQFGINVSKI